MNCLICKNVDTKIEKYEGADIDICPQCSGVWLDREELNKIIDSKEEAFTPEKIQEAIEEIDKDKNKRQEVMGYVMSFKKDVSLDQLNADDIKKAFTLRWGKPQQKNCPKCDETLEEFSYAGTGVMLDRCPGEHGFWLDNGELEKMQIAMERFEGIGSQAKPESQRQEISGSKTCPACKGALRECKYEGISIDDCPQNHGVWLDEGELSEIVKKKEMTFSEDEQKQVDVGKIDLSNSKDLVSDRECPVCRSQMSKRVYTTSSGIIIDRCLNCLGVWLDADELAKIQIFVEKAESMTAKELNELLLVVQEVKMDYEKRRSDSIENWNPGRTRLFNGMVKMFARRMP